MVEALGFATVIWEMLGFAELNPTYHWGVLV